MKIDGSAVRMGMVIELEGKLWLVVKHEIRTPGNLRSFNQVEIKDVKTGTKNNLRFSSAEKIEQVRLERRPCNFMYADGDQLHVMDNENYEQYSLPADLVGEALKFLQEGMTLDVEMYESTPITIALPETVVLEVMETDPVVKGQTAASSYKPAIMNNGVRVLVPPFITAGEMLVVNVADATYRERAKKAS